MKYKIGDKVRIKKNLVVGRTYGDDTYVNEMDDIAKDNDYVLTIGNCEYDIGEYVMDEDEHDDPWYWTDAMIEGLVEMKEIKNMKYKIGDKVRIRRDLVVGDKYGGITFFYDMAKEVETNGGNVVIITDARVDSTGVIGYKFGGLAFIYSESMIEGLAEPTDREKFEGWMRKLSSLKSDDRVWNAFNYCVTTEPDKWGYEDKLKIISDYLFAKKMTKAEIEAELGYKIEIVEE